MPAQLSKHVAVLKNHLCTLMTAINLLSCVFCIHSMGLENVLQNICLFNLFGWHQCKGMCPRSLFFFETNIAHHMRTSQGNHLCVCSWWFPLFRHKTGQHPMDRG